MRKSGSYFKPRRKLVLRRKQILTITTVLLLGIALWALYSFTIKNTGTQSSDMTEKSTHHAGEGIQLGNQPSGKITIGNEPPSEKSLLKQINDARKTNGVPAVSRNSLLDMSAKQKLNDMVSRNYWAHNAPDGTKPWYFIKIAGYSYKWAGENLWYDKTDTTVQSWLDSPKHRAVMLDSQYKDIGIAIRKVDSFNGWHNVYIAVAHFGTPIS